MVVSVLAGISLLLSVIFAAPRDFIPDFTFQGSSLTGWHSLGQADWTAVNGEIVGVPRSADGGWLVWDKSYQDLELYTEFRCAGSCTAGILLRAEKTSDGGLKGIYVQPGESTAFEITLSAQGKEVKREALPRATAQYTRIAAGPWANGAAQVPGFARPAATVAEQQEEAAKAAAAPAPRPAGTTAGRGGRAGGRGGVPPAGGGLQAGDWNTLDAIVDTDMITVALNKRRGGSSATNDRMMGYGPIALYVAGSSEVRFRDFSVKDLNRKTEPAAKVSEHFRLQALSDFFYSWGAGVGDINHDGIPDVVAGPFYFTGPDYTERHEFTAARTYSPGASFPEGMTYFVHDYTGDGWADIICVDSRPIFLYVNPKGESRRWDRYNIVPSANSELEVFRDIDGDGKPEILFMGANATVAYAKPDPANPTAPWQVVTVSDPGLGAAHGMGVGDINGDGRMDIVNNRGWWEGPPSGDTNGHWKFHAAPFGNGGAEMGVYDVNGDGLPDIVTGIMAHGWGLAWFEQQRSAQGENTFVRHDIMGDFSTAAKNAGGVTFSEPHGMAFGDMDGDGIPDMVVGKRLFSHLDSHLDPDPQGPAVLYWYRTVRDVKAEGGAKFVPELIHNRSGVGSQFVVTDLNGDGAPEVVTSGPKGTFVFWNLMKPKAHTSRRQ
ncbi:MAG TPA: FG-GAP-like repeat-containing protein [Bryobacteraceae bacterium]